MSQGVYNTGMIIKGVYSSIIEKLRCCIRMYVFSNNYKVNNNFCYNKNKTLGMFYSKLYTNYFLNTQLKNMTKIALS